LKVGSSPFCIRGVRTSQVAPSSPMTKVCTIWGILNLHLIRFPLKCVSRFRSSKVGFREFYT
jgi:hypothetical protein